MDLCATTEEPEFEQERLSCLINDKVLKFDGEIHKIGKVKYEKSCDYKQVYGHLPGTKKPQGDILKWTIRTDA